MIAEYLRSGAEILALVAEAIGVLVVAVALVRAAWRYGRDLIRPGRVLPA